MLELKRIKRIELICIVLIVILLTGWGLYTEYMHHQSMLAINLNFQYTSHISYHFFLNTIFPGLARAVLLLEAWYIFHFLLYPKIISGHIKEMDMWYAALVLVCTASGVFLYHYQKVYLEYHFTNNLLTNIRAYSQYRKLTVFMDTVGILVFICLYEFLAQLNYYVHQQMVQEKEWSFTFLRYFLLACMGVFSIIIAFFTSFPDRLWEGPTTNLLFYSGLGIQVYILQHYFYQQIIPAIQTKQFIKFSIHLFISLLLVTAGSFIFWICYSRFRSLYQEHFFTIVTFCFFISAIIGYTRHMLFREKSILRTQVSAKSAELSSLRSQINPHFLFNALNSLYATALKEKSDKTADGIQKLGDMMRFMLEENNQDRIPLDKEIEYLHNYIDIQRMRIDESQGVEIRINIQQQEREIYIAPMMLNPFVENAFKHGVSLQHPSWIYITLTLDATRLYFKVHNSLHQRGAEDPEENSSGVGLANVKKRLELLYPGRHTLDIQQSDKDYFVSLTLAFETKNG